MTSQRLQFLSSRLHFEIGYHFFLASARSVAATNLASDDVDDTNVHSGKEDFDPRRGIWKERNGRRGRQSEAAVGADGCDV